MPLPMEEPRVPQSRPAEPASRSREGVLERALGVVISPRRTLREIVAERAVGQGVLVTLAGAGIAGGAALAAPALAGDREATTLWVLGGVLLGLLLGLPLTAAWSGLCHGAARLLGQRGPYAGLFAGYGYANALAVLQAPLALLAATAGDAGSPVSTLLSLVIAGWGLVLMAIAIRVNYGASMSIAIAAIILALVALLVIVVMVVLMAVVLLFLLLFALLR